MASHSKWPTSPLLAGLIRPARRAGKRKAACFVYQDMADFLNGTVLVPFLLLAGAVFSKFMLEETLRSDKMFLGIGGGVGLRFALKGYFNGEGTILLTGV